MARRRDKRAKLEFPPPSWLFPPWQLKGWNATQDLAKPRTIIFNAGRGAGKDILAIRCCLRDALKWYERQRRRQREGKLLEELNPLVKVWVVAPQENNLKQSWDDWQGILSGLAKYWGPICGYPESETSWLYREVVRENKFILFGRGQIEIEKRLSCTRDALRGPGVDLVHWTEFATETVPGELDRAYRVELPGTMTRAGRLGRLYATTTPKGPIGGFWDVCSEKFGESAVTEVKQDELTSEDGLSYYLHAISTDNNLLTEEQVIAIEAERKNGWMFLQERMAEFVLGEASGEKAFDRIWIEKCLVTKPAEGRGYRQYLAGSDIARFGNDETCHVIVDEETVEIVHIEFHAKQDLAKTRDDFSRLHNEFPGIQFKVDSTGHRGYIADFVPSYIQIQETQFTREKEKWVGGLKLLMQLGKLRIPDPDHYPELTKEQRNSLRKLILQLQNFVKVVSQGGGISFRHAPGSHDDGVDALLLATMRPAEKLQQSLGKKGTKDALDKLII